jgi:uncharacterized protein (TIGR02246 family)
MRLIAILLLLAVTCPGQTADDTAIRALVKEYIDARDRQDAKAVEALFTSSVDQLVSSGEWRKGRDEVVKGTLASTRSGGGRRTVTLETIRYLAPGVAIADGRYELEGAGGAQARRMWSTFVLAREGGKWKIAAIRNMLPAPPAN